ncbi:MAG: M28 family metallopeptidase, partial [Bacteroidia bacterium]|nr:M28 family metallopeptidase [Bacteroidia bacterium]MDW8057829.1 M28 family metallopeptidase [Bacteroidia bacterium]
NAQSFPPSHEKVPSSREDSLRTIWQLRRDVRRLSALKGRAHGTPYAAKAVQYIVRRFRRAGYSTIIVDTFPLQVYRLTKVQAWISTDGKHWRKLRLGKDFIAAGHSPPLKGTWQVDTFARPGSAWKIPLLSSEQLLLARQKQVPILVLPTPKLTATIASEVAFPAVIQVRSTLPDFSYLRLTIESQSLHTLGWNVAALLKGLSSDSAWVVGAHYDHLGFIGQVTFPGANDNSSGVAMLLTLAHRMKAASPPPYDVWFVAFGAEELGLVGSRWWVQHPPYPLERMRGMLNFDLMGFGEKGIAIVGAADQPALWQRVDSVRTALGWNPPLLRRSMAANSDQFSFYEKGVPALFFYLEGGPGYYHDIYDRPQTLSWHGAYPFLRWIEEVLRLP